MSDTVIKVENVGKLYRLGEIGTGTLSHDLNRWWAKMRGKEDPFAKIGEINDRTQKGESEYVWALRDINFEVKQGEVLGIIGRNGAGKSTLLKILSKVTTPSTGRLKIKGRIASLLEVGTGFHPELTGRENIFLNGAILGMTKREIQGKFDEIVDFSGVERYIDTPVKRYSSGMYVRLAFAVAAHLESEIFIVDEVLAVGDAEFQRKCLGKMGAVSRSEGRTVLFVSHHFPSIKRLCPTSMLLVNGSFQDKGPTDDIITTYLETYSQGKNLRIEYSPKDLPGNDYLKLLEVSLINNDGIIPDAITTDADFHINFKCLVCQDYKRIGFTLILRDIHDTIVFSSINNSDKDFRKERRKDEIFIVSCKIDKYLLNDQTYKVTLIFFENAFQNSFIVDEILSFSVEDGMSARGDYNGKFSGVVRPKLSWKST